MVSAVINSLDAGQLAASAPEHWQQGVSSAS